MTVRLLSTLGLIIGGIAIGYAIQVWARRRKFTIKRLQRTLQVTGLLGMNPIIFIGAV
jgi:predicted acetyltransferase